MNEIVPDYLNPEIPAGLPCTTIPMIEATSESLEGYGLLVDHPEGFDIEIVTLACNWLAFSRCRFR